MSLFGDDDIVENDGAAASEMLLPQGLTPPKASRLCIGHNAQEQMFLDLFEKNSLPHAMIFSGSDGIGKTTMAFRLARFLIKNGKKDDTQDSLFCTGDMPPVKFSTLDVAEDDPVFSRISSGAHADLLHIAREYNATNNKLDASLKVDALRKIEPFLRKTSTEGGWRVVIIEDADTMNRNAQNAILKILEEPPKNVLIMLIANRTGNLIPTIRSRARTITFSDLSPSAIGELLAYHGRALSVTELEKLSALSGGSIGRAVDILNDEGLEMLTKILDEISALPRWNWQSIHAMSASLGQAAQDRQYRMFAQIMQWIFRQILFQKARGVTTLPAYLDNPGLEKIIKEKPLERLIAITDDLKTHFEHVDFSNLDRRDAVRCAFLVIES